MSRLHFKPMLEAMDERIVPDATPLALPDAPPAATGVSNPGSMSDDAIADRIAAIQVEQTNLSIQSAVLLETLQTAEARYNQALLAVAAAATPEARIAATARLEEARRAFDDVRAQLNAIHLRSEALEAERRALQDEQMRREQGGPGLPRDPVGVTTTAS